MDCFGDETLIEPAGHTKSELDMIESDKSWDSWGMFTLSEKYKDKDETTLHSLLLFTSYCGLCI